MLSAYTCGGSEKAGKMAKLIQAEGCVSGLGFIRVSVTMFMCVNMRIGLMCMCVHTHLEANGQYGLLLLKNTHQPLCRQDF